MQNIPPTSQQPQYPTGVSAVAINIYGAQVPAMPPIQQQLQGPAQDTFERTPETPPTQQV